MKKILFLFLAMAFILGGCTDKNTVSSILAPEEAKAKALEFTQKILVGPSNPVEAKEIVEDNGLYKIVLSVGGRDVDAYMTMDGNTFFPQGFDIDVETKKAEEASATAGQQAEAQAVEIPKSDKPNVEVFVMSHCPYGTQIEKGILPVIETLGDTVDFEIKFCDYAMHGDVELNEQLAQYCIQKEQNDKFFAYLNCFLESGQSEPCLESAGINVATLNSCVSSTDDEFKVTANSKDQSTYRGQFPTFNVYKEDVDKYGIGGSPALVINGKEVASARDSSSLLRTICNAFSSSPEACNASLSTAAPAAGFGSGTGSASNASCN